MKRYSVSGGRTASVQGANPAVLHGAALTQVSGAGVLHRPPEQPHPAPGSTDSGDSGTTTGK